MAFCTVCGKEVMDTAVVCVGCGSPIKSKAITDITVTEKWTSKQMWIYGILGFLLPIIGIILGIVGLFKDERRTQGAMLLAISICAIGFWKGFFSAF